MMNRFFMASWGLIVAWSCGTALAQEPSPLPATQHTSGTDTTLSLNDFLQKGNVHGRLRSYWMATDNQAGLTDAYAWGLGASIGYTTPRIARHLELGVSGFFMFNLWSSDLSVRDAVTGQPNRYEIGLFNLKAPQNRKSLDRLEELYLRYYLGQKSKITLGRQLPKGPFINPQDGRLSPTFTEGVVVEINDIPNTQIQAEYLYRIAPRSTVEWFKVGESLGLYPIGVGLDGKPSQYVGNTSTKGIVQLGVTHKYKQLTVQLWDSYVDNIFNTAYAKTEFTQPLSGKRQFMTGLQGGYQSSVGDGGNPDITKAYFTPGSQSLFFSGRVSYKTPHWAYVLNATRITAKGRYLMPREWGRDPFYTFMPRERNEGFGDVTATTGSIFYTPSLHWKWEVGAGVFKLSEPTNFRMNKYGLPSYSQINVSSSYHFTGFMEGLDLQLLLVRKDPIGKQPENRRYIYNKVDMTHINLILNYHY